MSHTPKPHPPHITPADVRLLKGIGIGLGCAFLAGLGLLAVVVWLS
ncbi:hypothetical protein [Hymenobacter rubripertinctus]|nr:hypothetical protein [Hymenobacter rubripertinctus]